MAIALLVPVVADVITSWPPTTFTAAPVMPSLSAVCASAIALRLVLRATFWALPPSTAICRTSFAAAAPLALASWVEPRPSRASAFSPEPAAVMAIALLVPVVADMIWSWPPITVTEAPLMPSLSAVCASASAVRSVLRGTVWALPPSTAITRSSLAPVKSCPVKEP